MTPGRELLEMIPESAQAFDAEPLETWNSQVPRALGMGAALALPGWSLLAGRPDSEAGLRATWGGRSDVLLTRADRATVRLARRLSVPESGQPRLMLEFAHQPGTQSRIELRVEGEAIWEHVPEEESDNPETVDPETAWLRHTVDLSDFAGQRVWLTVVHTPIDRKPAGVYWGRIDLDP
jgi:hypothetical protein